MSNTEPNHFDDRDIATRELIKKHPSYLAYRNEKSKLSKLGNKLPWSACALTIRHGSWNNTKAFYEIEGKVYQNLKPSNKRKNKHGEDFTEEEMFEAIRKYPTLQKYKLISTGNKDIPTGDMILHRFGSWNVARQAATGAIGVRGNLDPDKPTVVYLVWFPNDELLSCEKTMGWKDHVHKVGITQNSIQERGKDWPNFHIVEELTTTLEEASSIEAKTLKFYSKTKWLFPALEGNGWTECFICLDIPKIQK